MSRSEMLHDRQIRALLAAEVISTTGAQMTWVALPWFVLLTTGSATKTTFVVAAEVIGLALFGLPGGRLLGRFGGDVDFFKPHTFARELIGNVPVDRFDIRQREIAPANTGLV